MPSQLITVRYPSRMPDYEVSENTPAVGDVLRRNGDTWIVEEVLQERDGTISVALRPIEGEATG